MCMRVVYLLYYIEYTPVTTTTQSDTVPSIVNIILIITIVLILLVLLSVITALVIIIVVLYRKIQLTYTATPTAATHPYEYIDMDKVVEHMSPARTADDTDYIQMTEPQYSNLK